MGPLRAEVEIDAPRARVFAAIGDLSARPPFTDPFLCDFRLTRLDASGVGAGARFRVATPLRTVWEDTVIITAEQPFRIIEEGSGGRANRIRTHTVWELTEAPGSLTAVRVSHWTEPANRLDRMLEIATCGSFWRRRGWGRALQRLRDQLESDSLPRERLAVAGGNRSPTGIP
jgi:uncharacterized protein YndB with AHSA1/START domain